jgi:hypothetical protein
VAAKPLPPRKSPSRRSGSLETLIHPLIPAGRSGPPALPASYEPVRPPSGPCGLSDRGLSGTRRLSPSGSPVQKRLGQRRSGLRIVLGAGSSPEHDRRAAPLRANAQHWAEGHDQAGAFSDRRTLLLASIDRKARRVRRAAEPSAAIAGLTGPLWMIAFGIALTLKRAWARCRT